MDFLDQEEGVLEKMRRVFLANINLKVKPVD
jgi:hypothetical protein